MTANLTLEEQLVDVRSNQIAYKLTILNPDLQDIRLLAVRPRVPTGAQLLEITDSSLAEANAQKAELLEELTSLLREYLWLTSEELRKQWLQTQQKSLKELTSVMGIFSLYLNVFTFRFSKLEARFKNEFQ